jgi:putative phosphoribosyl transferase
MVQQIPEGGNCFLIVKFNCMYLYYDRLEAGHILARQLEKYKNDPVVVLAIPRGGVPVAYVIGKELGFPVDIVLTKKIGHPMHKEYAIGAVSLTDVYVIPHKNVSAHYINKETELIREKLRELDKKFRHGREPEKLEGKTIIIVDDGIATGNTLITTVSMLKKSNPGKIVIAVPVASREAVDKLSREVDEVVCPLIPDMFIGVGGFYENFQQLTDEEAISYFDKLRKEDVFQ